MYQLLCAFRNHFDLAGIFFPRRRNEISCRFRICSSCLALACVQPTANHVFTGRSGAADTQCFAPKRIKVCFSGENYFMALFLSSPVHREPPQARCQWKRDEHFDQKQARKTGKKRARASTGLPERKWNYANFCDDGVLASLRHSHRTKSINFIKSKIHLIFLILRVLQSTLSYGTSWTPYLLMALLIFITISFVFVSFCGEKPGWRTQRKMRIYSSAGRRQVYENSMNSIWMLRSD